MRIIVHIGGQPKAKQKQRRNPLLRYHPLKYIDINHLHGLIEKEKEYLRNKNVVCELAVSDRNTSKAHYETLDGPQNGEMLHPIKMLF